MRGARRPARAAAGMPAEAAVDALQQPVGAAELGVAGVEHVGVARIDAQRVDRAAEMGVDPEPIPAGAAVAAHHDLAFLDEVQAVRIAGSDGEGVAAEVAESVNARPDVVPGTGGGTEESPGREGIDLARIPRIDRHVAHRETGPARGRDGPVRASIVALEDASLRHAGIDQPGARDGKSADRAEVRTERDPALRRGASRDLTGEHEAGGERRPAETGRGARHWLPPRIDDSVPNTRQRSNRSLGSNTSSAGGTRRALC